MSALSRSTPLLDPSSGARVVDHLYIGDRRFAANLDAIQALGITKVVNATIDIRNYFEKLDENSGHLTMEYLRCPCHDTELADLSPHFDTSYDFIHSAITSGQSVLIHCQQGISRSATLTIAYLIRSRGMSLADAYTYLRQQRSIVKPKSNFLRQLMKYANKYQTIQSTTTTTAVTTTTTTTTTSEASNVTSNTATDLGTIVPLTDSKSPAPTNQQTESNAPPQMPTPNTGDQSNTDCRIQPKSLVESALLPSVPAVSSVVAPLPTPLATAPFVDSKKRPHADAAESPTPEQKEPDETHPHFSKRHKSDSQKATVTPATNMKPNAKPPPPALASLALYADDSDEE